MSVGRCLVDLFAATLQKLSADYCTLAKVFHLRFVIFVASKCIVILMRHWIDPTYSEH